MATAAKKRKIGGLEVEWMAPEELVPYARNPRRKHQVARVKASLVEFGWRQPIVVDERRVVIAGHARLHAALDLGMERVPVHVAADLSEFQAKAYRIADNRSAEGVEWDEELLALEIGELDAADFDLETTGFKGMALERLLELATELGPDEEEGLDLTPPSKPDSEPGKIYRLGPHRLMCGDSTSLVDLRKLVGRAKIDCLWTDPPYGVKYVGKTEDELAILNDDREGLESLLRESFSAAHEVMAPAARFYIASPDGPNGTTFRIVLEEIGWRLHQVLVWVKNTFVLGRSDHHYQHEAILYGSAPGDPPDAERMTRYPDGHHDILYGWKPGPGRVGRGDHNGSRWWGGNAESTVFVVDRPNRNADHPTSKPVELIRRQLQNSTRSGDRVLDLFGGSGSTLIACEQLGRRAYLMELDPGYCDVIRRRYDAYRTQQEEVVDG